jgi:predicted GH43/DUF377 family glycosyl hydrolase
MGQITTTTPPMSQQSPPIERSPEQFISDDRRVITRLFVPGGDVRLQHIIDRIMHLTDKETEDRLSAVMRDFGSRHRNVEADFEQHAKKILKRVHIPRTLSPERKLLVGAYFTMEYSIESAALFNPSIVAHPDQSNLPDGACRFIMSLRATGEGHISSIVFRTGVIDATGDIHFDELSRFVGSAKPDRNATFEKYAFFLELIEMGAYTELAGKILDQLPSEFTYRVLRNTLDDVHKKHAGAQNLDEISDNMLWLARSNYQLVFPPDCPISEVVIFPVTENESRGIEDARFVRFTDDDGSVSYYGTYTAYNGFRILPQLLHTNEFRRMSIVTLNGKCVQNKGMALFPRKIDGRYFMIGRIDGENLHLMASSNIGFWNQADVLRPPEFPWEYVQIGNCGSPIETDEGWLLLTHGVGPMRRYCIGAMLLDLEDPSRVIAVSREPILSPNEKEREGYVPNVVYSCGAMVHDGRLIMPYAMADSATSIATANLKDLTDYLLHQG